MPRMGSSKRLSRSSTARSLVMTMLDTRCRSKDEFAEVRRLLRGEVVQPQVIEGKQLGGKEGPESAVHRVVNPSLGHGFEEAVGIDEAYGVSGADGGVAAGLGQEALPDASSAHQQHMLMLVQELQGKDSVQQTALQGD